MDTGMLIYKGLRHAVDKYFSHILHGFWKLFLILWPSLHRRGSVIKKLLPRAAGLSGTADTSWMPFPETNGPIRGGE